MVLLWFVLVVLAGVLGQKIPENPCPDIFAYRQQSGNYYGDISIPYDGSTSPNLAVNISMTGLYQDVKLKLDLLTPADSILSASVLKYRVNFPFRDVIPKITQIMYNGKVYCYGPAEPVTSNGVTNLWANILYKINQYTYDVQTGLVVPSSVPNPSPNPPQPNPSLSTNPFLTNLTSFGPNSPSIIKPPTTNIINEIFNTPAKETVEESCGLTNDIQALVLKGKKTTENEYPWLVAMFHRQGVSYDFQCTANLISNRHIVTAAHCVRFYKAPLVDQEDILLVLGHSDLTHWASTGAIIRTAQQVVPHPNYKQDSGHCDVAIIKMNEDVTFKPSIRPICLWNGDVNLKTIVNSQGVVAGWGKSEEERRIVAVPRKVSMAVVSQETCLRSHDDFKTLTSEMTFCAGNRDGSGPCSGDSGAGFIVKKGKKWYLRGVVSTAIKNDDYSCNLNEYIVFVDLAKFKDWVKSAME